MVIFSTLKRTSKKNGENCLLEDDVRNKCLQGCTCLKKVLQKKNSHTPPPPHTKNDGPSLISTVVL